MNGASAAARWGWRLLVAVAALLALNGVSLYLFLVDTQVEQTIGLLLTVLAVLALAIALEGLRHGSRWSWRTSWLFVAGLVAIAAHTLRGDRLDIPAFYLILAVLAAAGLLLARPHRSAAP